MKPASKEPAPLPAIPWPHGDFFTSYDMGHGDSYTVAVIHRLEPDGQAIPIRHVRIHPCQPDTREHQDMLDDAERRSQLLALVVVAFALAIILGLILFASL